MNISGFFAIGKDAIIPTFYYFPASMFLLSNFLQLGAVEFCPKDSSNETTNVYVPPL